MAIRNLTRRVTLMASYLTALLCPALPCPAWFRATCHRAAWLRTPSHGAALLRAVFLCAAALLVSTPGTAWADDEEAKQRHYHEQIKPVLAKHCFDCHNEADKKGGLNLEDVFFVNSIIRNGATWSKVTEMISSGQMPPDTKPRLSADEVDIVVDGINGFLMEALAVPDPGLVTMRRLSHREYGYSMLDLLGVDFNTRDFFPADGSGGEGFDNHARVLYITTLSFERYYEAAEIIVDSAYANPELWRNIVPEPYKRSFREQIAIWWHRLWHREDISLRGPVLAAEEVLHPLAAKAYRRFPAASDKEQLINIFTKVYTSLEGEPNRFDLSIKESLKVMLISPHFLYRHEVDLPLTRPYPLNGFELASRLAYFLWSSLPDEELLNLAYRGDLHDERVLEEQVHRMLADPRSRRFAESFVTQWLGVSTILDNHEVDAERFPELTPELRRAMYDEIVTYFHHVLTERKNFLDLLDSDYAFLNASLAEHYGIDGFDDTDGAVPIARVNHTDGTDRIEYVDATQIDVAHTGTETNGTHTDGTHTDGTHTDGTHTLDNTENDELVKVSLTDRRRGGVLGMGSVLMATSLPTRTSPVLRGKWVLEQILGTPPPPPPADVPEIEEAKNAQEELDLREILTRHRDKEACAGCHMKMDPIGFGMENFDAIGRWREAYGDEPIDATGVLADGTAFAGPVELKQILLEKETLFAANLSKKMLSFALGRSIRFQDKPTVDALTDHLLENDFHTVDFITELVTSFPFRFKKSDPPES